ncbi:Asp-tRNA(Asn)/Glu-tRNA(Gln) amidotransferase subunit GatA [Patescibacteria group bacterium]|nr:Asp-tRNA(Asn)/Glu-tRNA(Gln) amidotransferase subunit GatA [Patescibacteria group bacterium]
MQLTNLTIEEAHKGLVEKQFSTVDLAKAALAQIKKVDEKIKAFITIRKKEALAEAKEADGKIVRCLTDGVAVDTLAGIPAAIKDNILVRDTLCTAGSNILANYVAPYDATVIEKLKKKNAVILGKTNCDAFAHGASTENSDFGPTRNPWDLERTPGGSSGGSAAAVAAGQALYALGTDTGGSIRGPASFCGVVGLKPSYGRISRYGLISMASSTDCPGIIAKTVRDAAIILECLAGPDKKDSTTVNAPVRSYLKDLDAENLKGLKIGIPEEYFTEGLDKEVERVIRKAVSVLESQGAEIIPVNLPHTKYAMPVYYIITPSEISANLARYDGIKYGYSVETDAKRKGEAGELWEVYSKSRRYGFGDEAKRRIMLGTYALSAGYYDAYYLKAQRVRTLIKRDFDLAFGQVDCLAAPVEPHTAFKIGSRATPLEMYLEDIFVSAVSLAGLPAVSVPCGFAKPKDGNKELPVGLQIIGKSFDEATILKAANIYEKVTEWRKIKPSPF